MHDDADIALVLSCYEAFGRGDIAAAVAPLGPDAEWIEPDDFAHGGARRGPGAVADYLQASYDSWAELHSEPIASRQGTRIVVVHHVHGLLTDGSAQDVTVADVFTVRGGVIVHMQAYADPADVPGG